jgi:hypothetical protein
MIPGFSNDADTAKIRKLFQSMKYFPGGALSRRSRLKGAMKQGGGVQIVRAFRMDFVAIRTLPAPGMTASPDGADTLFPGTPPAVANIS